MGRKVEKSYHFKLYRELEDGSYSVSLVLRYHKQRKIITLPFTATPEQWDGIQERYIDNDIIKASDSDRRKKKEFLLNLHPDRKNNNLFLNRKANELRDIISDFERRKIPFTNSMIEERLFVVLKSASVEKYLNFLQAELKTSERFGTASTFSDLKTCLCRFDKHFAQRLFPDNVGSPETYPFSNQYGTRIGKDVFCISKKLKTVTRKRNIPLGYLQKFFQYEFNRIPHQRSKGLFFFSFFCGGINFADMAKINQI